MATYTQRELLVRGLKEHQQKHGKDALFAKDLQRQIDNIDYRAGAPEVGEPHPLDQKGERYILGTRNPMGG